MSKVRVYEVARELGLDNRELVSKIASMGIQVRNHMSALESGDVDRVKRAIEKDKQTNLVEERIRPTVVRRRSVAKRKPAPAPAPAAAPEPAVAAEPAPAPAPPVEAAPEPVVPKPAPRVSTPPPPPAEPLSLIHI